MWKLSLTIVACILLVGTFAQAQQTDPTQKEVSIIILSGGYTEQGIAIMDPKFKEKMEAEGYTLNVLSSSYRIVANGGVDLNKFNVALLYYPPSQGSNEVKPFYEKSIPLIYDFIKKGGGAFVFADENYASYIALNSFLEPSGAKVLPECIADTENSFRQDKYFQEYYDRTTNIAEHPITKGVTALVFPLGHSPTSGGGTLTFTADENWTVVIRAMKSAYSLSQKQDEPGKKTYTSEPPIVAVRTLGKGRMVFFPTRSHNFIAQGYRMVFEGLCLGDTKGYRLMANSIDWLAEPSLQSKALGGYVEPPGKKEEPKKKYTKKYFDTVEDVYPDLIKAGSRPFVTTITHTPRKTNDYVGVIGVYTSYSKGFGSVKDFCDRAKSLGYDYLVFTEAFESMTPEKYDKLMADCAENSDENFLAIPGLEIKDAFFGQTSVIFDIPRWPDSAWLDPTGTKLENHPGIYFGFGWIPKAFVNNRENFNQPYFNKFYSCLEVFSYYRGSRFMDDVLDWYLQCQGNEYNLIPLTCHRLYDPPELDSVTGFKTYVLTENIADISKEFVYHWYSPTYVYISEGPKIKDWAVENGRQGYREELWKLYIDVTSDVPISEVIVYDRKEIFRRFKPNSTNFKTEITGYHDKQHHFTLMTMDSNGNRALSSALYVSDKRQSTYMCTDLQNTLNVMYNLTSTGEIWYYGVQGAYVTGWSALDPPLLYPSNELFPTTGIEYGYGGWKGGASHEIPGMEGGVVAQRDMIYDSGDCNILNNLQYNRLIGFKGGSPVPTDYATSSARYISFTPRPYSLNPMIIEQETVFKKDTQMPDVDGPELQVLSIGLPENSFPDYAVLNPGVERKAGTRADFEKTLEGTVDKNGYFASYPDFWGSLGVFAMNNSFDFLLTKNEFRLGYDMPSAEVKKGDRFRSDYIVIRGEFGQSSDAEYENFYDVYGFDGTPAYAVSLEKGKVLDQRFVLKLEAEDYVAKGSITKADLPNDLGITVTGLCDNWDSGMLEVEDNNLRRVGTFEQTGYIAWNINNRDRSFVIGNLVTCDDTDVKLNLIKENGKFAIYAHNPKDETVTVTITTPEWLSPVVPVFSKKVDLPAGQTLKLEIE